MAKELNDQVIDAPVVTVDALVETVVVAIDNTTRKATTKADATYGFPTVANTAKIIKDAVGLISAMRLIVQPTFDENDEVVKQHLHATDKSYFAPTPDWDAKRSHDRVFS